MSDSVLNPEQLRLRLHNALVQILKKVHSTHFARQHLTSSTERVFEEVGYCVAPESHVEQFISGVLNGKFARLSTDQQEAAIRQFDLWSEKVCGLMALEFLKLDPEAVPGAGAASNSSRPMTTDNDWMAQNQAAPTKASRPVSTPRSALELPPVLHTAQLPDDWPLLVPEMLARLKKSGEPFVEWSLPQPEWACEWLVAHRVVSHDSDDGGAAIVLIPDASATNSQEARRCWLARVEAASRLRKLRNSPSWSRVLSFGNRDQPAWIVLEKSPLFENSHGNLNRKSGTRTGRALSLDDLVVLGRSLCQILGDLNALGIHVLDLTSERIIHSSSSLQLTHLIDPTAVVPAGKLLPEWRGITDGRYEGAHAIKPGPSQVLLIGSVLLSLLCETTRDQIDGRISTGRSATFATLAGVPELSDARMDRISEPLASDVSDRSRREKQRTDGRKLVQVLAACLHEEATTRFETVSDLEASLRNCER